MGFMSNPKKRKGTAWENLFAEMLEEKIEEAKAKRIPGSGAIGTIVKEPFLQGDVRAVFKGFNKPFKFEAKVGYGGSKQLTIKKEWLDKIKEEASYDYSIPALACKFSGARLKDGVQYFIILDFDTFCDIMNIVYELDSMLGED